jgi:O-antigen/teichoic acid export membrane protein
MSQKGSHAMLASFERAIRGLGALAPILALILSGLAEPLLVLMYGHEFRDAAPILVILAWAIVFNWLYAPLGTAFQGRGYERVWLVTLAVGLALNVGANMWAIPQWGAIGAAGATLFSEIGILVLGFFLFVRKFPIDIPWKSLAIGVGATGAGWTVLQGLSSWGAVPSTLLSVLVFSSLIVTLRYLTKEDAVAVGGWFRQAVGG